MNTEATPISADEPPYTEINMSRIKVGGGVMGFLFAAATAYIFVVGIPAVRWFFVGAISIGVGISLVLRVFHKHIPVRPFTSIWH
jgi:hypothetical protein